MKNTYFYFVFTLLIFLSCNGTNDDTFTNDTTSGPTTDTTSENNTSSGDNTSSEDNSSSDWLIPISEVKDGGPGKDGIPSIDSPKFVHASIAEASFLNDEDLIIGIVKDGAVRAYPHKILDWHEIINDNINDNFITISYCPLTGTAFAWKSVADGVKSTFGVSGLLYNTNLILYDRNTDSNWSQLKLKCVNGDLINDDPILEDIVETNWGTWKKLYPNTKVLGLETGFSRNYNNYPYGDYKTNNDFFIFPAVPRNNSLPNKERVYAIIYEDDAKVYQFENFIGGKVVKETFKGKSYLVVGDQNLIYSFELSTNQSNLEFEYNFNNSEVFFSDNEGNKWSIFGKAIQGPRVGEMLKGSKSVVGMWFAIAAFYPNPKIYNP